MIIRLPLSAIRRSGKAVAVFHTALLVFPLEELICACLFGRVFA